MIRKRELFWMVSVIGIAVVSIGVSAAMAGLQLEYKSGIVWPEPKVVTPGKLDSEPPSDAIVLFDGKDLSKWTVGEKWDVKDGVATSQKSDITTKDSFGDCQLHIEFAKPE
ncbi:MAG TPA: family 16 glycoside hydrolase, partial [Gemmata sp.]|nr:family 16 glycoside hydrolase [Gemmata sp.]